MCEKNGDNFHGGKEPLVEPRRGGRVLRIKLEPKISLSQPRKSTKVMPHCTDNNIYSINIDGVHWTSRERATLLLGMKKYGIVDLKQLRKVVPTKTEEEIKRCIDVSWKSARYKLAAAATKKKELAVGNGDDDEDGPPIEKWLHEVETVAPRQNPVYNRALPKVFHCIAQYETHPSPEECGGVDYREAYEYIGYMLAGLPGKSLSPATAKFVLKSLTQLGERIRSKDRSDAMNFLHYLQNVSNEPKASRTYTTIPQTSQTAEVQNENVTDPGEAFENLLKLPGVNPLNVPLEYLRSDETR